MLLTHDHHGDNLDPAGRALLPSAGVVVTTASGAKRLGGDARGLEPWASTRLEAPGRPTIEITATPCRHGPPLSHPIVGDVIGFALRWDGQQTGCCGSRATRCSTTACARSPTRLQVDTALLHLGGVRFPVTGPVRYTMTAQDAVELCRLIRPRTAIPIHYEGWKHFRQGRDAIEREFAGAPEDVRRSIRWLPIGVAVRSAREPAGPGALSPCDTGGSSAARTRPSATRPFASTTAMSPAVRRPVHQPAGGGHQERDRVDVDERLEPGRQCLRLDEDVAEERQGEDAHEARRS